MKQLQEQTRAYIGARMALVQRVVELAEAMDGAADTEAAAENVVVVEGNNAEGDTAIPTDDTAAHQEQPDVVVPEPPQLDATMDPAPEAFHSVPPMPDLPPDMGDPIADGEGGLVVSSIAETTEVIPPRNEFPPVDDVMVVLDGAEGTEEKHQGADLVGATLEKKEREESERGAAVLDPAQMPARFLADIGKLSREVVRNCEEKVALAVGAYNSVCSIIAWCKAELDPTPVLRSLCGIYGRNKAYNQIDRHIRALDSALSAQETSLILGLRPDTLPSSGVDQSMNLAGDMSGLPDGDDEGGMVLGIGGGAGGGRKKKGKKGRKTEEVVPAVQPVEGLELLDNEVVDPYVPLRLTKVMS